MVGVLDNRRARWQPWTSILHVSDVNKFIPPFIELVRANFSENYNIFYIIDTESRYFEIAGYDTVHQLPQNRSYWRLLLHMMMAKRVVLHSLSPQVSALLAVNPWLLKKCYWIIWGDDLYRHRRPAVRTRQKLIEMARRIAIRRMGYLVTYVPGDVELARAWYGARGRHIECLMYPSNLHKIVQPSTENRSAYRTLLVGNSATPTNRHEYVFDLLALLNLDGWRIVAPLSYGIAEYADKICALGQSRFGDRFQPLLGFLPYEQYLRLLADVDIGVFAHDRQQGMGNIITLLGMGKTVFMDPDVSSFRLLAEKGIEVKSVRNLTLETVPPEIAMMNKRAVENYFSQERLERQLAELCS